MKLIIENDAGTAATAAAQLIAEEIGTYDTPVLGLATGRTMEGIYARLAQAHEQGTLDFSCVTSFNLDEYVGLSAEDPRSYHYYMQDHLFRFVNIDLHRTHLPDGAATDLDAECAAYEAQIARSGGIDLQLLGIGDTGHIGFNEPPSSFDTRTRCVELMRPRANKMPQCSVATPTPSRMRRSPWVSAPFSTPAAYSSSPPVPPKLALSPRRWKGRSRRKSALRLSACIRTTSSFLTKPALRNSLPLR